LNEPLVSEPLKTTVKITNKRGLHARASAKVVEAAARFQAEITIIKDGTRVNARSIMGLMMLAASLGSEIGVEANGPDQDQAMTAMLALIEAKFGEE
jgi:phosphocarrier protein HPr